LRGTLPPDRRASESPIAIACLRLVTFLPERPERSLPRFISCMLRSTLREDFGPYLRRDFLRPPDFLRPLDFLRVLDVLRPLDFLRVLDFLRPPDVLLLDERRFELLDFFLGILLLAFPPRK